MAYYLGVDIGSGSSKAVLTQDSNILIYHSLRSGINYKLVAKKLLDEILVKMKLSVSDIAGIVKTGQGAGMVEYTGRQIADIRCCAKGMINALPEVRTVIDIEGQSTQVMRINDRGQIVNFITSERCAAGAGRFLDIISNVLQIPLAEIGELSLRSTSPVVFTTACAVFGESEAVSRVAEGVSKEDIVAGVHKALAEKIGSMVDRVGLELKCGICGGGALNLGLIEWVRRRLGIDILVPPQPQYITAYGAALFAAEPEKSS